ncbi:MAG TPA: uroporphyrinogen decarboxylase, partial [Firmicutes bacterium]|nr:uroporphyrinogen decarboxylase [Bacillota bacterium]
MLDVKALKEERTQLFEDIYNGIIPKRVPVMAGMSTEFCIEYAGLPLAETQWTLKGLAEAYDAICQLVKSDTLPAGGQEKSPAVLLKFLNSKGYAMSSSGYIQHRDITTLEASEYDDFINAPYDFMMEKVIPRMFTALDSDPVTRSLALAKAYKAYFDHAAEIGKICRDLISKHGYYVPPPNSVGTVRAPFDLLGDFMRGVKGIYTDVRRCPEKVIAA